MEDRITMCTAFFLAAVVLAGSAGIITYCSIQSGQEKKLLNALPLTEKLRKLDLGQAMLECTDRDFVPPFPQDNPDRTYLISRLQTGSCRLRGYSPPPPPDPHHDLS